MGKQKLSQDSSDGHLERLPAHRQAVERVILLMREQLTEPFSLLEMAKVACLSPFHFDRIFHAITGIPPVQFLYALRIEAAKCLLLTTSQSITNVCYEVGYNSVGTFTSRFTQLVGLSPRQFRRLASQIENPSLQVMFEQAVALLMRTSNRPAVTGRIITPQPSESLVFVGLFPTLIPQGRPIAGTLLAGSDTYCISSVKDGRYNAFAAAFPKTNEPQTYLLPDAASLLVGLSQQEARVEQGKALDQIDMVLRPLQLTDPPILIALPFLLMEILGEIESTVA